MTVENALHIIENERTYQPSTILEAAQILAEAYKTAKVELDYAEHILTKIHTSSLG